MRRAILTRDSLPPVLALRCAADHCPTRAMPTDGAPWLPDVHCAPSGCYLGAGRDEAEVDRLALRCGYDVRLATTLRRAPGFLLPATTGDAA